MERRRGERRVPNPNEPVCRVRLRTGRELTVIDVSNHGALIEGARLLPGTHVDVHVTTQAGRVLVRCRIARAYVAVVTASVVSYRSAVAFDQTLDTSHNGYRVPALQTTSVPPAGTGYPNDLSSHGGQIEKPAA